MQSKRTKRTRIRAAKPTAHYGHKKKNRGAGHRGGRGKAGTGKRGSSKLMMLTQGKKYLGKYGFKSLKSSISSINLNELQLKLTPLLEKSLITKNKEVYEINLDKLGYQKLLSKGDVKYKLNLKVKAATQNAISRVEKAGGKVDLLSKKKVE